MRLLPILASAAVVAGVALPEGHPWVPAGPGDSRAPCPAINSLANHGYIPRNGKNIPAATMIDAIVNVYGFDRGFATFLTMQGIQCCSASSDPETISSLFDMGLINTVEHPASLVHNENLPGMTHGSSFINQTLVNQLVGNKKTLTLEDFARHRIRREAELPQPLAPEFVVSALAEVAFTFLTFGDGETVDSKLVKTWFGQERLHRNFVTPKTPTTIPPVVALREKIGAIMADLRSLD